jgi:hypothetical protein
MDDSDSNVCPSREPIIAPDSPKTDIEIGIGRSTRRKRGGRRRKFTNPTGPYNNIVNATLTSSTTNATVATGATSSTTKCNDLVPKKRQCYEQSLSSANAHNNTEIDPNCYLCGIGADRNSSYKSMMPTVISYGAWQPYAISRDLTNIAAGISAIATTISGLPTHRKINDNASESSTTTTTTTTSTTAVTTKTGLVTAPSIAIPTPLSLTVQTRDAIVTNLKVLEFALNKISDVASTTITDGITSGLVHLDSSEILGHGPLIPITSTKYDTDRSVLTGQSHRSVLAASNVTQQLPN